MENKKSQLQIRRSQQADRESVVELLKETQFFRPNEITIAEEVFDDAIAKGPTGDYQSFVAVDGQDTIGWVCFGQTPCTIGTYDIYWVAVHPQKQKLGVGKALTNFSLDFIKKNNGRLVVVDTSGSPRYISTRLFYEKLGFVKEACLKNFYAPDDDKIIYIMRL